MAHTKQTFTIGTGNELNLQCHQRDSCYDCWTNSQLTGVEPGDN